MVNQQRIASGLLIVLVILSILHQSAEADTFGSGANTFDIEFVTIGNPGNAADTTGSPNPAGSVPYAYRMGQFEISERMIDKANALGGLGITKNTLSPDKPATGVSWNEAARFINWLNTSSGSQPAYKFALQPGEVGYSAKSNIELWTIGDAGYNLDNLYRNSLARYFLPSVDEWYKAAYYDPTSGVYYNYPTSSDSAPDGIDFAGDPIFDAVFSQGGFNQQPNDITNVGVLSPYGTAGQGGNVWEWEETDFDLQNDLSSPASRGVRGGVWNISSSLLLAAVRDIVVSPAVETNAFGFRVASSIPEPSTLLLLCVGSLAVLWRRRSVLCATIVVAVVSVSFADPANADTFGSGANTFDIEFVTIGNPGNAADTTGNPNPAGSVSYSYRMGKFEISEQMIDKANVEGGLGISRFTPGPDKPATGANWNEVARFVNWLNSSTGSPLAYKFAIQPGQPGYDANANIELWTVGDAGYNPSNLYRNSLARHFLPSGDEWYKAAYYDPSGGIYYDYPTGSDSVPDGFDSIGDPTFDAVFLDSNISGPNDITNVGVLSPYGTAGQGGNVDEWEETDFDLVNGPTGGSARGIRGGPFNSLSDRLLSSSRISRNPFQSDSVLTNVGFRVASTIPEPSSLLLLCFGSLAALWRRREVRNTSRRTRLRARRVFTGIAQNPPQVHHARAIESQFIDGSTASRRHAMNDEKVVGPDKVLRPIFTTGIKQRCGNTGEWIYRLGSHEFAVVAPLARKREVRILVATTARTGNDVFHGERVGGKPELTLTILATIRRALGNHLAGLRGDGHVKSPEGGRYPTGRASPTRSCLADVQAPPRASCDQNSALRCGLRETSVPRALGRSVHRPDAWPPARNTGPNRPARDRDLFPPGGVTRRHRGKLQKRHASRASHAWR